MSNYTTTAPKSARYTFDPDAARVHLPLTGSSKLGRMASVSTVPGPGYVVNKDGRAVSDVRGTCDGCGEQCAGVCFATRQFSIGRPQPVAAYSENTIVSRMNPLEFVAQIVETVNCKRVKYLRVNAFGEFERGTIAAWDAIARACPECVFFGYTKRREFFDTAHPANLVISWSAWRTLDDVPAGAPVFVYDDGTNPELADLPHCPAVTAPETPGGKGKRAYGPDGRRITCATCKACAHAKPGTVRAVYNH